MLDMGGDAVLQINTYWLTRNLNAARPPKLSKKSEGIPISLPHFFSAGLNRQMNQAALLRRVIVH